LRLDNIRKACLKYVLNAQKGGTTNMVRNHVVDSDERDDVVDEQDGIIDEQEKEDYADDNPIYYDED